MAVRWLIINGPPPVSFKVTGLGMIDTPPKAAEHNVKATQAAVQDLLKWFIAVLPFWLDSTGDRAIVAGCT